MLAILIGLVLLLAFVFWLFRPVQQEGGFVTGGSGVVLNWYSMEPGETITERIPLGTRLNFTFRRSQDVEETILPMENGNELDSSQRMFQYATPTDSGRIPGDQAIEGLTFIADTPGGYVFSFLNRKVIYHVSES